MAIRTANKPLLVFTGAMLSFGGVCHALPFSVVPMAGTSLPTQIASGQTISALYTITNNTGSVRSGNYMKYLPPNTSQVTTSSGFPDLCGSRFTLQPHGAAGDSCTLELNITGPVNSSDPDPHHHLFACFVGGLTCAGTNFPLNVSSVSTANQLVASGVYDTNSTTYGGIATSSLSGTTWNQQILPLPSGFVGADLYGNSCSGNNCVAVGALNTNSASFAAIATSTDSGNTWTQQALSAPSGFSDGYYYGVTCTGNTCIAAGAYTNNISSYYQSAIAVSNNGGMNWSQQILPVVASYMNGYLQGINCSGNICAAAGSYEDSSFNNYAAITFSTNGGSTWSQTVLPILGGYEGEILNGVSCSGSLCIAVGQDFTGANTYPGIAVSNNAGNSWTQTAITTLPGSFVEGELNGISCISSTYCVAVGYFSLAGGSDAITNPAVLITTDGGNSWSEQALNVPAGYTSGIFYSVECMGNTCAAAGNYLTAGFVSYPAVAVSTDGGYNWTQQALPNPSGVTNAQLNGIS